MARPKKQSKKIQAAEARAAGMESIDEKLDLGNGLTLEAYRAIIAGSKTDLAEYNTALSTVDTKQSNFEASEKVVATWTERMLDGVSAKFGKESDEYAAAGGTKKSQHKRPPRTRKLGSTP